MDCYDLLRGLPVRSEHGAPAGVYAVCSIHPLVIDAALHRAAASGSPLLIETTSNQVNQLGGYTGMTPAHFMRWITERMESMGVPPGSIAFGSDHAGPFPWRHEPAAGAMDKAATLVAQCAEAGYVKIHLDATMHLADDAGDRRRALDPRLVARRTAELCKAAEIAWRDRRRQDRAPQEPVYVVGTDVPAPGGTESSAGAPDVTRPEDLLENLRLCREAFTEQGLQEAWKRVIAVVVQPAVEHGEIVVHHYDRRKVRQLVNAGRKLSGLVFEAHATDYQAPRALREMVEDGFAILKVGPSLTGAVREALFLLEHIESTLSRLSPGMKRSSVSEALEAAMLADPRHWKAYYRGNEEELAFARKFALSDRCRYYWGVPSVKEAVERLIANLRAREIPLGLMSQYFPRQYVRIQNGELTADPESIIKAQADEVLAQYDAARTA